MVEGGRAVPQPIGWAPGQTPPGNVGNSPPGDNGPNVAGSGSSDKSQDAAPATDTNAPPTAAEIAHMSEGLGSPDQLQSIPEHQADSTTPIPDPKYGSSLAEADLGTFNYP